MTNTLWSNGGKGQMDYHDDMKGLRSSGMVVPAFKATKGTHPFPFGMFYLPCLHHPLMAVGGVTPGC